MNHLLAASIGIVGAAVMFLPSVVAHLRHVQSFRNVSALNALAVLTLLCGVASVWFLFATAALWGIAAVIAIFDPRTNVQPGASPNVDPAERRADSGIRGGPASVSVCVEPRNGPRP